MYGIAHEISLGLFQHVEANHLPELCEVRLPRFNVFEIVGNVVRSGLILDFRRALFDVARHVRQRRPPSNPENFKPL